MNLEEKIELEAEIEGLEADISVVDENEVSLQFDVESLIEIMKKLNQNSTILEKPHLILRLKRLKKLKEIHWEEM